MTTKRVFISYKREDRPRVKDLADNLQRAGNAVWFDESLQVGDHWWDAILGQIEQCDVFVFAISQRALRSIPCQNERAYAATLGKPLLLIQVGPLTAVPTEYALIQYENFSSGDPRALIDLIGAINRLPVGTPSLPGAVRPPVPIAPVEEIAAILDTQPTLEFKDQTAILYRLKEAAADPLTRRRALELVQALGKRTQFVPIQEDCRAVLATYGTARRVPIWLPLLGTLLAVLVVLGIAGLALIANPGSTLPTTAVTTAINTDPANLPSAPALTPTLIKAGTKLTPRVYARMTQNDMSFVYVPRGCFRMGSDLSQDARANPDEQPQHEVCVTKSYWIGEFLVTNGQFSAFEQGNSAARAVTDECRAASSEANQPVVCLLWPEADAFAKWYGCRLPTEAEWEYAARSPASLIYPWGNVFDQTKANTVESGLGKTVVVDSYPDGKSWVGAYGMAGNVWEWSADKYDSGFYVNRPQPDLDPVNPYDGQSPLLRGGSWRDVFDIARATFRRFDDPNTRSSAFGMRLACSVGGA